ncbi:MAG TPA: AAA family ATPase, partial [Ktedonobacterales bacterium]|nr:AAA family ATPase [Ktedonobacterales bacterium]
QRPPATRPDPQVGAPPHAPPPAQVVRPALSPFVGRQREWARLMSAWRASRERPQLALIVGEPGAGKTRLAEELRRRAEQRGIASASARSYAMGGSQPYAPLTAWLRSDALWPALIGLDDLWLSEAARIVPELLVERPTLPQPGPLTEDWQRQRFFEALRRTFRAVGKPLLLLLDDLHWCDRETLDWLHSLIRSATPTPLLVVATLRAEESAANQSLVSLLETLRHDEVITELDVGPLSARETATLAEKLAGHPLADSIASRLFAESEGNPLFIVQFIRAGYPARWENASDDPTAAPTLPPNLQELIAGRLAQVTPAVRELLGAAATIGREFSFDVLARVNGGEEARTLAGLEELWQRRIVRERSVDTYDFSHDKLREVAYLGLSAARRRILHRRIAESLEEAHVGALDAVSEQIASHYDRAGKMDQAIAYYERAGDQAQRLYAWGDVERLYRRALALLERGSAGADEARMYEKLGMAFSVQVRLDESLRAFKRSTEEYKRVGDLQGYARTTAQTGETLSRRGDHAAGLRLIEAIRDERIEDRISVETAGQLQLVWARILYRSSRYQEALDASTQAAELAKSTQNKPLIGWVEFVRGSSQMFLEGRLAESERILDAALPLARETGDLRLLSYLLNNLAYISDFVGAYAQERRYLDEAVDVAVKMTDPDAIATILSNRSGSAYYRGAWREAREDLHRVAEVIGRSEDSFVSLIPPYGFGMHALAEGDEATAAQLLDRAMTLARKHKRLDTQLSIKSLLAEADLVAGHAEQALARLEPLIASQSSATEVHTLLAYPFAAWAYADLGDGVRALDLIESAVARGRAQNARSTLVDALRIQALLAVRRGQWMDASALLDEALGMAAEMPYPYAEAKALYVYGQLHAAKGESQQARQRYEQSLAVLNRLGERLYAEHVERALASLPR